MTNRRLYPSPDLERRSSWRDMPLWPPIVALILALLLMFSSTGATEEVQTGQAVTISMRGGPGVTTILSRFKDAGGLIHWAWQIGKDGKDYREERDKAADAGTLAHSAVEAFIRGTPVCFESPDVEINRRATMSFCEVRGPLFPYAKNITRAHLVFTGAVNSS